MFLDKSFQKKRRNCESGGIDACITRYCYTLSDDSFQGGTQLCGERPVGLPLLAGTDQPLTWCEGGRRSLLTPRELVVERADEDLLPPVRTGEDEEPAGA